MPAALLDTNVLIWLLAKAPLRPEAWLEIVSAQSKNELFVCAITAWEAGTASKKRQIHRRPNLLGLAPDAWFQLALKQTGAGVLSIDQAVATEASLVPDIYGSADPGDCFLIATARIHNLTLVTRDERILELGNRRPKYLKVLAA
jgi:PIN domain nuclease of toxin-antitoxin system